MFRADLHMHSHFSDGQYSPHQLIDFALAKGLSAISITDHDIYDAYSPDVLDYGKSKGITLLPGIEFSCDFKGNPIHILAYNMDKTDLIMRFCEKHTLRRKERFESISKILEKKGVKVKREEFQEKKQGNLGRVFIAQKLVEWGYAESVKQAFNLYLADRYLKNMQCTKFSIGETVAIVKQSGGKAFLAHPHLIRKKRLIYEILDLKALSGIECFYGFFPPHVDREWEKLALDRGLLVSGGSDFHGPDVTAAVMGTSWVDKATAETIFPGKIPDHHA
ncbi:phosphatase [Candidatus Aerophobetes bacterium]|uniref:Phosphatase n=1 Tax=Aerophobetes bacterium TaxID=2030807 RepID=A0A2A4WY13_UNCAE|nr:MAG: phosphatase [Candidatus Aerophobetes bacterium]